jgi:hypothetical protein
MYSIIISPGKNSSDTVIYIKEKDEYFKIGGIQSFGFKADNENLPVVLNVSLIGIRIIPVPKPDLNFFIMIDNIVWYSVYSSNINVYNNNVIGLIKQLEFFVERGKPTLMKMSIIDSVSNKKSNDLIGLPDWVELDYETF